MTFAVRPLGSGLKGWEFVGAGAAMLTTTVNFPSTAQPGDLAVWCGTVVTSGTPPAGWALLAAGSTLQAYKVCVGGETSASWTATSGTREALILLFRPVGGAAVLHASATDSPTALRTMTAGDSPSVIVAIGNSTGSTTGGATLPGTWNSTYSRTNAPALYVAWRTLEAGESTGQMQLSGGGRQTFGIFGVT